MSEERKVESLTDLPELEKTCTSCHGEHSDEWYDGARHICLVCNGSGYEPTEFGLRVLELMRHHLSAIQEQAASH
jgi:Tryptophan RNA-binding attenuator protein inhibitory protein